MNAIENEVMPVIVVKKLLTEVIKQDGFNTEAAERMAQARIDNYFKDQHEA